ncbi:MAG: hypothetical protein K8T90_05545 [Planctomycetes bacterium]|nr:hypothetical protein [Planctomycetota bacterium]
MLPEIRQFLGRREQWSSVLPDAVREGACPAGATGDGAAGFALPVFPGAWPQGALTTSVIDPRRGDDFTRTEAFTGAASVTVAVRSGATTDSVAHAFPAK